MPTRIAGTRRPVHRVRRRDRSEDDSQGRLQPPEDAAHFEDSLPPRPDLPSKAPMKWRTVMVPGRDGGVPKVLSLEAAFKNEFGPPS